MGQARRSCTPRLLRALGRARRLALELGREGAHELAGARLTGVGLVEAVEERTLLGQDKVRALAFRPELDGRDRDEISFSSMCIQ